MPPRSQRRRQAQRRPCEKCHDLDFSRLYMPGSQLPPQNTWPDDPVRAARISIQELVESKKKGCQICFAVLKAIALLTEEWLPQQLATSSHGPALDPAFAFLARLDSRARSRSWVNLLVRKRQQGQSSFAQPLEVMCNLVFSCAISHPGGGAFIRALHLNFPHEGRAIRFGFEIYSQAGRPVPWPAFQPARHVPLKLHSERRQKLLASWIQECNSDHPDCCVATLESLPEPSSYPPPKSTSLVELPAWALFAARTCGYTPTSRHISTETTSKLPPKRLLDLGGNPRNYIRLVDTEGLQAGYATVSYRPSPGPSPFRCLDAATIHHMRNRIPWADLAPAFQDAVVVASEQGIRYLWIDVLCTLQDSAEEINWRTENLHEIYGQSYLNIALSQAPDERHGLFGKRWLDPSKETEIKYWQIDLFQDGKAWPVFARYKLYNSHGTFHYSKSNPHSTPRLSETYVRRFPPMFTSAWTLQERALAPRTVHLGTSEMAWECRTCTQCECSLNAYETPSLSMLGHSKFSMSMLSVALIPLKLDRHGFLRFLWRELWPVYSHLQTSSPGSRLQALVGLAAMFQKPLGCAFVAGLFASAPPALAQELVWGVERNGNTIPMASISDSVPDTCKFTDPRVPSWTWLSMIARWPDAVGQPEIVRRGKWAVNAGFEVVQITTTTPTGATENHPLNAENWTLHLRGEVILGKISTWDRRNRQYQFVPSNYLQFPPSLPPPPPPPMQERRVVPAVGGLHIVDATPRGTSRAAMHLPPILPAPDVSIPSSPSTTDRSGSTSPDLIVDHPVKPRVPLSRPLTGQELISTMGMFTPDCDVWDDERRGGAHLSMDGVGSANHTYAYFLLLGTISMHVTEDFTEYTDVGIVLQRASAMSNGKIRAKPGTFQRVGYFTSPRVPGPRGLGNFFKEAQIQDIVLV